MAVSLGESHACAIAVDASVLCWGDNDFGQADAPGGSFVAVSVRYEGSCGVRAGGSLLCWGDGRFGLLEVPDGEFVKVFARRGCALGADGEFVCWARARANEARWADVPEGRFVELSLGSFFGCARREEGSVLCWSLSAPQPRGQDMAPDDLRQWPDRVELPVGDFVSVSVGAKPSGDSAVGDVERVCGLRAGGSVSCWALYSRRGSKEFADEVVQDATLGAAARDAGVGDPFAGPYVDLSISQGGQCGLRAGGEALCWGGPLAGSAGHLGELSDIAASDFNVCGIDPHGAIECWARLHDWALAPPAGAFTEIVAVGDSTQERMCGLREDHKILCWTGPDGPFGAYFGAFYTPDGELHVPEGRSGEHFVAEGEFVELSTQGAGVCGLRADGSAVCWGHDNMLKLRSPPPPPAASSCRSPQATAGPAASAPKAASSAGAPTDSASPRRQWAPSSMRPTVPLAPAGSA